MTAVERIGGQLPSVVRNELAALPDERQEEFREVYESRRKTPWVAWVLWLLGWHFAYFGRWGLQIVYLLTGFGLLVWWIIEAFRLPGRLKAQRHEAAISAMRDVKAITAGSHPGDLGG